MCYCLKVFQHVCPVTAAFDVIVAFASWRRTNCSDLLHMCCAIHHGIVVSLSDTGQVQKDGQSVILSTVLVDITTLVANIVISTTSLRLAHLISSVRRFRSLKIHVFLRRKRNKGANSDSACVFVIRYRFW